MTDLQTALSLIGALLVLIVIGLPTAVALLLTAFVGLWLITRDPSGALKLVADQMVSLAADPQIAAIPLFFLLSSLITQSNLPRDTTVVAASLLKARPHGLVIAAVGAHAITTAIAGQSMPATIAFASRAASDLKLQGYPRSWIGGTLAGASILGILAPASLWLVAYAVLAGQSVSKQVIAGAIPNLIMAGTLVVLVAASVRNLAITLPATAHAQTSVEIGTHALPVLVLAGIVLGGLYSGVLTPVEASALGATSAFLVGLVRERIDWAGLGRSAMDAAQHAAVIILLLFAGLLFSKMLTSAGTTNALVNGLTAIGLGKWGFLLLYVLLILAVASVLDAFSLLAIAVPLAAPVAIRLDFDPLQFGVITVLAIGCGMLAPPFGIAPFTVKAMLGDKAVTLDAIFANAAPYFYVTLALLCAVASMPWLSLALIR